MFQYFCQLIFIIEKVKKFYRKIIKEVYEYMKNNINYVHGYIIMTLEIV